MIKFLKTSGLIIFFMVTMGYSSLASSLSHPRLLISVEDRGEILQKIENEAWAKKVWESILLEIDPLVERHKSDSQWIVSRMSMYWKEGERYTQCYIKKQNWDYGEGNAPVPTVRLPGMRIWNNYINVPLEERLILSESGEMLGIDRSSDDKSPVLVPYKETGQMVRANNNEILGLAES